MTNRTISMLEEVQIVDSGGIPIYFFRRETTEEDYDPILFLKASFFTAMTKFAEELDNGDVRLIRMDRQKFYIRKELDHLIIFGASPDTGDYESQLEQFTELVRPLLSKQDKVEGVELINDYLVELKLIPEKKRVDPSRVKSQIESVLFRSVGYIPGQCNIGRAERLQRLTFGLIFLVISLALNLLIIEFALPAELTFLLVIPNFFGFLGILQYFYRFCTTNALSGKYTMR